MTRQQDALSHSEFQGKARDVLLRLQELHPKLIDLSLGRLENLLARLGHPERQLPPVIHVAGTNGKGSTCASLRAIAEHAGLRVHVMTSPHLLDVTERFRIAGTFVTEKELISTLKEIEHINDGAPITVFEVLTAAGFLLFSRTPADLAILEVGLGGRCDATNVISTARACIITSVSLDHQAFLGDTEAQVATEKAGIIKSKIPVIIAPQKTDALNAITVVAQQKKAPLFVLGREIIISSNNNNLIYKDENGSLTLPHSSLPGSHQAENAALAIAALRHSGLTLSNNAYNGIAHTQWPARLQTLKGKLAEILPPNWTLTLDGGHNPGAGEALAEALKEDTETPLHLIVGLKDSKDVSGFLSPLLPLAYSTQAVAEPKQHLAMPVDIIQKTAQHLGYKITLGPTLHSALNYLSQKAGSNPKPARVLICGSLYLAGCALKQDGSKLI